MWYDINVAKLNELTGRYEHFFGTHERSCTNYIKFKEVYNVLKEKFPEPEFKVSATKWEHVGELIYD